MPLGGNVDDRVSAGTQCRAAGVLRNIVEAAAPGRSAACLCDDPARRARQARLPASNVRQSAPQPIVATRRHTAVAIRTARSARQPQLPAPNARRRVPKRIDGPRRRTTAPIRTNRRRRQSARRRAAHSGGKRRHAPGAARTIGVSIEDRSREALRAPLPRRPRVMKPVQAPRLGRYPGWRRTGSPSRAWTRSGPRPRANLHAKRARAGLRRTTRPLTVAGAAQAGDLLAEHASCFPFNRATCARAPRRRQFRSGPRERQESVETHARRMPDTHIRGKKPGCYDWKRYRCRNARYSALKCWVFRGRSRCSTNSKPYLKILAV